MLHNPLYPPPLVRPARKHFESHHLRRVPLRTSERAERALGRAPHEARLLPQALRELCGGLSTIGEVALDVARRSEHLDVGPADFHPLTGEESQVVVVTLTHANGRQHTVLLNLHDLHIPHRGGLTGFRANEAVQHLLRSLPASFYEEGE